MLSFDLLYAYKTDMNNVTDSLKMLFPDVPAKWDQIFR